MELYGITNVIPTILSTHEYFQVMAHRQELRQEFALTEKRVYAYLPTFRGTARTGGTQKNDAYLLYSLYELDHALTDDEILYVNLHPIARKKINFRDFIHIRTFPAEYETYDFLNMADVLITDYSSVFFDFACTKNKIVLFPYDKADYLIQALLEDLKKEDTDRSFTITNISNLVIGAATSCGKNTWTIKMAGEFSFSGLIHSIPIEESDLHHTHFLYAQYKLMREGNTYTLCTI